VALRERGSQQLDEVVSSQARGFRVGSQQKLGDLG